MFEKRSFALYRSDHDVYGDFRISVSFCVLIENLLNDPQGVQAAGGGRFPHRRGLAARGAGEVDPARASFDPASVVGAPPAGVEPGGAHGAAAAGPLRPALPGGVQEGGAADPPRDARASEWMDWRHPVGRGIAAGPSQVHRRLRRLGPCRGPHLARYGPGAGEGGARRGAALGRGPVRGRRLDPARSPTARLRGVRQRPEPGRLPDPQGDAGGHPAPRVGAGRRAAQGRRRDQAGGGTGVGRSLPPRTRTEARPSPTCGRARCAARPRAAGRRSRCCARCG